MARARKKVPRKATAKKASTASAKKPKKRRYSPGSSRNSRLNAAADRLRGGHRRILSAFANDYYYANSADRRIMRRTSPGTLLNIYAAKAGDRSYADNLTPRTRELVGRMFRRVAAEIEKSDLRDTRRERTTARKTASRKRR